MSYVNTISLGEALILAALLAKPAWWLLRVILVQGFKGLATPDSNEGAVV